VQNAATQVNSNTLMALTGNEGTSGTALLNLLQSESRLLQAVATDDNSTSATTTTTVGADDTVSNIKDYLNPSVLSAILICLFILSILIFAFLQLMYVQTPEVFVNTSIDFGKIEK
jgi:hypothetical protein